MRNEQYSSRILLLDNKVEIAFQNTTSGSRMHSDDLTFHSISTLPSRKIV